MADELKTMAEELKTTAISKLPEAISVSEGDCILVVQNRKAKKARPSLFRGPKGDTGLTGATGANPVLKFSSRGIEAKLSNQADSAFTLLVPIASIIGPTGPQGLTGATGANIIPRAGETGIEYKLSTEPDTAYRLLVPYSQITGPQGEPGKDFQILGYFDTFNLLETTIVNPNPGDAYGVGSEAPYPIFIWDAIGERWRDNGAIQGPAGRSGKSARVNKETGYWEEYDDEAQTWKQTEAIAVYPVATAEIDGLMSKDDKAKLDQMKGGDVEVSKTNIEKVLTGNITSHSHDRVIDVVEMPTDVWDGVSVSSSLVGYGTKDEPYLIQSCADYIHFHQNPSLYSYPFGEPTPEMIANPKQIKFTASLDFNNITIDFGDTVPNTSTGILSEVLMLCCIDGQGCHISNVNFIGTWAIIPIAGYCVIKNIHVSSGLFSIPLSSINEKGFASTDDASICLTPWGLMTDIVEVENVSFVAEVEFTGNLELQICFVGGVLVNKDLIGMIPDFLGKKLSFHSNITFSVNAGMTNTLVVVYTPAIISYEVTPILVVGYDCTPAMTETPTEQPIGLAVVMMIDGMDSSCKPYTLYVNMDNALPMYANSSITQFHTNKTTAEMKSVEFLTILNSDTETFVIDTENLNQGYPIFKPNKIEQVVYDGYVKESIFESFKKNMPGSDDIYNLDIDVSGIISTLDASVQTSIFGKTYTAPTSDNIIELLGGNEGIRRLCDKLVPSKTPIVTVPLLAYIYPSRLSSSAVLITINDSVGNGYISSLKDGCNISINLQFLIYSDGAGMALVDIVINNYNTSTQSARYTFNFKNLGQSSGGPTEVLDNLTSTNIAVALSANQGRVLKEMVDGKVGSAEITTIKRLTQSAYDALSPKNSTTLYVIIG